HCVVNTAGLGGRAASGCRVVYALTTAEPPGCKSWGCACAIPIAIGCIGSRSVAIPTFAPCPRHRYVLAARMVIAQSARVASCTAGAVSCSVSVTASDPPAPESVALVVVDPVSAIVPSAVVTPAAVIRFSVKVELAVAFVVLNATVPTRLAGTVIAIATGTFTIAPVLGLPLNGKLIGTLCTEGGSCANVAAPGMT